MVKGMNETIRRIPKGLRAQYKLKKNIIVLVVILIILSAIIWRSKNLD